MPPPPPRLADSLGRFPSTSSHPTAQLHPFAPLLGEGGSPNPVGPAVEESLQTPFHVEPEVPLLRQALLEAAATTTETLGLECSPPSRGTRAEGFQSYGLPLQTSALRPTLAWNPGQARSLSTLNETYSAASKFTSLKSYHSILHKALIDGLFLCNNFAIYKKTLFCT